MGWRNFSHQGMESIVLWIAALLFIYILAVLIYFYVYKVIMKGKKELSKRTIILSIITIAYIISVFTAVFLGRIVRDNRAYILFPFYSYREAWNGWSPYDWRGIILILLCLFHLDSSFPCGVRGFRDIGRYLS